MVVTVLVSPGRIQSFFCIRDTTGIPGHYHSIHHIKYVSDRVTFRILDFG